MKTDHKLMSIEHSVCVCACVFVRVGEQKWQFLADFISLFEFTSLCDHWSNFQVIPSHSKQLFISTILIYALSLNSHELFWTVNRGDHNKSLWPSDNEMTE